jgi:hypothetical protein
MQLVYRLKAGPRAKRGRNIPKPELDTVRRSPARKQGDSRYVSYLKF